jgi:hypothetical protein
VYSINSLNAKVGVEGICRSTVGAESLHEISNDNGVRVVNFATSKNQTVKGTMFSHCIIHKFTGHLLMERLSIKLTIA